MPYLPPTWTPADLTRELLDTPTRAWAAFPGLEVIDRPDWVQLTCVHFPRGGLNEISRSHLTADTTDSIIDATLAHYATRGLHFRWSVTPDATPPDLAARLARRGLGTWQRVSLESAFTGLDAFGPHWSATLHKARVGNEEHLYLFSHTGLALELVATCP
jgi:hypothetical protein